MTNFQMVLKLKNIFFGLFLSLALVSAAGAQKPNLNLTVTFEPQPDNKYKAVLTWRQVPNAAGYDVLMDGRRLKIVETSKLPNPNDPEIRINVSNREPKKIYRFSVMPYDNNNIYISSEGWTVQTTTPKSTPQGTVNVQIGAPFPGSSAQTSLIDYIYNAHKWAAGVGATLAVIMITWAGLKYTTSGGNPEALQDAKDTIFGALIGLAIIFLTYILLKIFGADIEPV